MNSDDQRVWQHVTTAVTKRYFTPLYEEVTEKGTTKKIHYLTSSTGLFAIFAAESEKDGVMSYILKDHQGSMYATVTGNTVERYGFDAWGRRRNPQTLSYDNVSVSFDRGYTMHEHYDAFGLINMNGRVYDPLMSSFLSPDNYVQDPTSQQGFNRYAYCLNNPLKFTDPSGYVVRGTSSLFRIFSFSFGECFENGGVSFNTGEALGQQLPKIEPFGKEEEAAYKEYRDKVFSDKKYENIQKELIRLEEADEVFRIRMGENITRQVGGGNFMYNIKTGEFDVNISDRGDFSTMAKLSHELKHADQYMDGKLGFDLRGTNLSFIGYDFHDEVEAFDRQGLFGKTISRNLITNYLEYKNLPNLKTNLTIDKLGNQKPPYPFDEMKELNKKHNEHNSVRFLYHGWQNDIK